MPEETSPENASASAKKKRRAKVTAAASASENHFCIAGIGASAGGLEAICDLFAAMPVDSNIAFVVIQHLYPTQKSLAAEIIGKHTSIPACEAEDGMLLEPGHIYAIPANTYPTLHEGRLHLSLPDNVGGPRLPIDRFFASLGDDQGPHAIGVILSGSGSDGSLGLKRIEANGGIVLAQQPETAQFGSMPISAIETGFVHCVLAVDAIPDCICRYARHDYVQRSRPVADEEVLPGALNKILDILQHRVDFSFTGYKRNTLIRRIRRRMGLRSINDLASYAELLETEPGEEKNEVEALFKDLLIGVTEFFRDPEAWKKLVGLAIRPMVARKKSGESIRIWVPGCATGEEAYTMAMLVLEELREAGKRCPLLIFATDANEQSLQVARAGSYPAGIANNVPTALIRGYFNESTSNHHFQVDKRLREVIIFSHHSLMSDPPFTRVDLICCRNLLIYLETEVQRKVIALFRFALVPTGYVFLGSAETVGKQAEAFVPLSKKWRIFQHRGGYLPGDVQLPLYRAGKTHGALVKYNSPIAAPRDLPLPSQLAKLVQQLLHDHFSPAAVLINANFETLYFAGPTDNYLRMPRGVLTRDLLLQVRDGLRSRLHGALRQASMNGAEVVVDDARVRRNKVSVPVRMTVLPTPAGNDDEATLHLVVFEDRVVAALPDLATNENVVVRQLEDELRATKNDLENSVERLETSNEELKVSSEEVVSVNEELQSINEELESSKEELQSLNEELTTVNQQLQLKVAELERSSSDIANLLASSQIATICLDRDLRIKWFSPGMRFVANIIAGDFGRPITDFSSDALGAHLVDDAQQVMKNMVPRHSELLSADKRWYLRRVVPYRSENTLFKGVVVTYADITEAKESAQLAVTEQQNMAATLERRVQERTLQLRKLSTELALTEERERRVVARDLHDGLGQLLAAAKLKLASLEKAERRGAMKEGLKQIENLVDQSNHSIRSLMLQLYPPTLQTLGLMASLEWLGDEMERLYGLKVDVDSECELPALPEPIRTTVFRAVRELLINVSKHANASIAHVNCRRLPNDDISISVTDEGQGFDYQQTTSIPANDSGFGLMSIRERLEFIGGTMNVDSAPGYGATVTLEFPSNIH